MYYPTFPQVHGYIGLPPGITEGDCAIASHQGAVDAQANVDPKAGIQTLTRNVAGIPTNEQLQALTTCYMQGFDGQKKKDETLTSFYEAPQGKKGLLYGGIAGLVVGIIVGKVLL